MLKIYEQKVLQGTDFRTMASSLSVDRTGDRARLKTTFNFSHRGRVTERNLQVVSVSKCLPRGVRRSEIERILSVVKSLGTARVQVAEVVAEPGMGKTWLLGVLRTEAMEMGHSVVNGRCTENQRDAPLRALARLFAYEATRPDGSEPSNDLFGSPWDTALDDNPRAAAERMTRRLLACAEQGGLVVLLDDLHWADDQSIEMIEQLVHHPVSAPLLVVIAHRPRQASARLRGALAHGVELGTACRVELNALSLEESAELIERPADDPITASLHEAGDGVPLYLLALAAERFQSGIPEQIATLIRTEIGQLDACESLISSAAAVLGDEWDVETLSAVAEVDLKRTGAALARLTARDILRPVGDSSAYAFRHPIVGRLVYDDAPRGWRVAAHRRAARFLAGRNAPAVRLAPHIARSQAGPNPADVRILRQAAKEALLTDPASSIYWLRLAISIHQPEENCREHLELMLLLTRALGAAGRLEESRGLLHQMLRMTPSRLSDIRAACVAYCALVECLLGNYPEARAMLSQELAALCPNDPPPEATDLIIEHGLIGAFDGQLPSDAQIEQARALARKHDDQVAEAGVLALSCLCSAFTGDVDGAAETLSAGAALIDRLPDTELAVHPEYLGMLAWAEEITGRFEDAQRHYRRGVAVAQRHVHILPVLLLGHASTQLYIGHPGEARRLAAEARRLAEGCNADQISGLALVFESLGAAWTGHTREAIELGEKAEKVLHERRFRWGVAAAMALAFAARLSGDLRRCATLLIDAGGCDLMGFPKVLRPACYEAVTAAVAGDESANGHPQLPVRLTVWAEQAEAQSKETCLVTDRAYALATRGHVVRSQGHLDAALKCFREAARLFADSGMVHAQALALVAQASCMMALGRTDDAEPTLLLATELARRSGAGVIETQIGVLRSSAPADDDLPQQLSSLTTRERQIAGIAAKGKRTREIADELSLSPRTVDVHLTRIYRKLNISSRSALAHLMASLT